VTHPRHELFGRCAGEGGEPVAGVPEVVELDVPISELDGVEREGPLPDAAEVASE
jgi:hypothetical protein